MLYIYFGNDQVAVRQKANTRIRESEDAGGVVSRYEKDVYEIGMLRALAGGASLFGGQQVIVLDGFGEQEDANEELGDMAELLAQSSDVFVLIAEKLPLALAKVLKPYAKEFFEAKDETTRFNTFALADALALKDKKTLWLLLTRSKTNDVTPEEVAGTLFWQLKSLRLAKSTSSAEEAGMKDFTYNKAKRAASKFTVEELQELSHSLIELYHDGHLGKTDLALALERWVLAV